MQDVKAAIEAFVKAGDTSDVEILENILHPDFQNIQDGFFDEKGVYVFSKSDYIELIRSKRFGGQPRNITFESIEQTGNIAIAKVVLESKYLKFFSLIIGVDSGNQWQIINNTPKIKEK